jgi:KDO2-lipid IV(A) lauroyltransferase
MSGRRSAIRNRIEDVGVVALHGLCGAAPDRVLLTGAGALSGLAFRLLRGRRQHAGHLVERTLQLAPPQVDAIVRGAFRVLSLNAVESGIIARRIDRGEPLEKFVAVEGAEHFRAAQGRGRGVVVATAHLGAWELIPLVHGRIFEPGWIVARELDNPLLEKRLLAGRGAHVLGVVPKEGGALKLARILRGGGTVGMLLDQNAGRSGVTLDFLGFPTSHHAVAGYLAQRLGAAVVPAYMLREPGRLCFRYAIEAPILADASLPAEEAALQVTRRVAQSLEARVRAHPDQWLWLHDRWRHAERIQRQERRTRERAAAAGDTNVPAPQGTNGG